MVSGWHVHDMHQLEYAFRGIVQVETDTARYLLPPQQAVWIPAGVAHNTTLRRVRTVSVFLDPDMVTDTQHRARVLSVPPVLREMILYAARWPIDGPTTDPAAPAFFDAVAALLTQSMTDETPYHLPVTTDPIVTAAMHYTDNHLDTANLTAVCAAVAVSERTLRRRFTATTGLTWRDYLTHSRMQRAMALLTETDRTILDIALAIGFDNPGSFARAFATHTGRNPSLYRKHTRRPISS